MLLKPSDLSNAAYDCHIIMETLRRTCTDIKEKDRFSDELVRYTEVLNLFLCYQKRSDRLLRKAWLQHS